MTNLRGIVFKLLSVCVFMAMTALIKLVSDDVPPGEVVFFRSAFAVPVILIWLAAAPGGQGSGIATANPIGHFWRGLMGTAAMGFNFAGLAFLPLPEVVAIGYAAPLLTVIFAAMFLSERVGPFRIATVGLGIAGVLTVLSPRLSTLSGGTLDGPEALGAMILLIGATFTALAQVFVRKLVLEERTTAIVFWFSVNSAVMALVTLFWGWVLPAPGTFAILVLVGLLGGVGQVLLTSSYRFAPASVVAPFEYASMVLALAVGYLAFDEVPSGVVMLGAVIIVTAGVLIIWRERRLGLERDRPRSAMTPQG